MASHMNTKRRASAFALVLALVAGVTVTTSSRTAAQNASSPAYVIRFDHWTDADERDFGEFLAGIGRSGCTTVNACLHDPSNPFQASDPPNIYFRSDCADLPYVLRAYFAWKRGLPFSYEADVEARGHTRDIRYTADGNEVSARTDVLSYSTSGYEMIDVMRDAVSSASFRIHPDLDGPY